MTVFAEVMQVAGATRRQWRVVAVSVAACATIAIVIALFTRPLYRAEAIVVRSEAESQLPGVGALMGELSGIASLTGVALPRESDRDEAMATLRSRRLALMLIQERNLLPVLFPERWDVSKQEWKHPNSAPTQGDALERFMKKVRSIREDTRAGTIAVRIDWHDRAVAADWANSLVSLANQSLRERALTDAGRSIEVLESEAQKTANVEVKAAIYRLMEGQIKSRTVATVRNQFAFKVVDPALVPEEDQMLWPKKGLLVAIGLTLGLVLGGALGLWRELRSRAR